MKNLLFRNLIFISVVIIFSTFVACDNNEYIIETERQDAKLPETERLSFANENDLLTAINTTDKPLFTKSGKEFRGLINRSSHELRSSESMNSDSYYTLGFDTLIPNPEFAKLFNNDGEIEVGEYIVKVTTKGTYKYKKHKESDFERIYSIDPQINGQRQEDDDIYLIEPDVYFYDTFKEDHSICEEISGDNFNSSQLRASIPEPNYNSFATFSADRHTVVGKILQNIIGAKITHTIGYASNSHRRIRGSFYDYNYAVYKEIGVQGWTDKKNWIGWSKTPSDELRVGWRNVYLDAELDDYQKMAVDNARKMQQPMFTQPKYILLPGATKPVYASIAVMPNVELSTIQQYMNKGAKAVFDFLKSQNPKSEMEKVQAAMVLTRTHLVIVINDETVVMRGVEEYTHVFANQVKIVVNLSVSDFDWSSGNQNTQTSDLLKTFIKIIIDSSKLKAPTLKQGEVFVCAYFSPEWQGMRIKK